MKVVEKLKTGTQILYTFPEPVGVKAVKATVIGIGNKEQVEVEWFDKEKKYHYMVIPKEYFSRIKIVGFVENYQPKLLFNKFHIKTNDWLEKPTMEIVKEQIKSGIKVRKTLDKSPSLVDSIRRTKFIEPKKTTKKEKLDRRGELSQDNVTKLINKRKELSKKS